MTHSPDSPPPGALEVAREGRAVLVRVLELGNMNTALTLQEFVSASAEEGYRHFAIDLADCTGMDSTFMGTLVGLARSIEESEGGLCLLNVSTANLSLLDMLGVSRFVPIKETFPLQSVETVRLSVQNSPRLRLALIREAHETLVGIDARNRDRFGAFLSAFSQEMTSGELKPTSESERLQTAEPSPSADGPQSLPPEAPPAAETPPAPENATAAENEPKIEPPPPAPEA